TPLTPALAPSSAKSVRRLARRRRSDRIARWTVSVAGIGIIALILGILVFIVGEVLPLTQSATVEAREVQPIQVRNLAAVLTDDYAIEAAIMLTDGRIALQPVAGGPVTKFFDAVTGVPTEAPGNRGFTQVSATPNGSGFTAL